MAGRRRLTEDQIIALKEVCECFYKEDASVRERQIRVARQMKFLWENLQRTWYSEVAHDWRVFDTQQAQGEYDDQSFYDKPVNVFRAYLESIIAALSITVPPIKCYPDNADSPLDIATAKAGDKIAELVFRHNDSPLLFVHSLFKFVTEGMIAGYNYTKKDKKYGVTKTNKYEEVTEMHEYRLCPLCGAEIDDRLVEQEKDKFQPDDEDVLLDDLMYNEGLELCPQCTQMVNPQVERTPLLITRIVGVTEEPKSRQCVEVYGLLNVKIPNWARNQADMPYLTCSWETHYANVLEEFPDLRDDHNGKGGIMGGTGSGTELYERWARLSPQYRGEYPVDNVTVRKTWLRPAAFNILDEARAKELKKLFPDGAYVCMVNDEYAASCNESLDDHWTISFNPLADFVNFDPLGLMLVSLQEITNDLISLILQTIEHGIPQTMVDPGVLDTVAYKQLEATPGALIPTKQLGAGKKVGDGFYEVRTASLSAEVLPFANMIQELAQLVSGALPSLFGGAMAGGGETASEYSMSRAQALQRLQTTWKTLTFWWKNVWGKVIPQYIKDFTDDEERSVERTKDGSFINVTIRKAELEGKLGRIELEAAENLPMTWSQVKDTVMQLLTTGTPEILSILGAPENLPVIREAIGLNDFYVPGDDDVEAEREEIAILLASEPIELPVDPMMAMQSQQMGQPLEPQQVSSVDIDPIYENHGIRFEIIRSWVVSDAGRLAKIENPNGYKNVLLHGMQHYEQMQMQMAQEAAAAQPEEKGAAPGKKPNPKDKPAPIEGESDVQTIN